MKWFEEHAPMIAVTLTLAGILTFGLININRVPVLQNDMDTLKAGQAIQDTKIAVLETNITYIRQGVETLIRNDNRNQRGQRNGP